jgi:hypothetical protein
VITAVAVIGLAVSLAAQKGTLKDVSKMRVDETLVVDDKKVKEDFAAELVKNSLRNALGSSGIEVSSEAPVIAQIELREFSSGSKTTRFLVGMGAGRASIAADLVIRDSTGKQLARKTVSAKGQLSGGSYQGNTTQRGHAFSTFEMRLQEEIARLK